MPMWMLAMAAEWCVLGSLGRVLLSIVHLLLELLRLLLVHERQANQAVLDLEGMEESSVLIVIPILKYFLIPYHTSCGRLRIQREIRVHSRASQCEDRVAVVEGRERTLTDTSTILSQ